MNRHRPTPLSQQGPATVRRRWREWIELARVRAGDAIAERPYDKDAEIELTRGVHQVGKAPFPVADAPARGAAQAFVGLVSTFTLTTGAVRRRQLAPALERLAIALDVILDEAGHAAAAQSRRMLGEHE